MLAALSHFVLTGEIRSLPRLGSDSQGIPETPHRQDSWAGAQKMREAASFDSSGARDPGSIHSRSLKTRIEKAAAAVSLAASLATRLCSIFVNTHQPLQPRDNIQQIKSGSSFWGTSVDSSLVFPVAGRLKPEARTLSKPSPLVDFCRRFPFQMTVALASAEVENFKFSWRCY